MSSPKHASIEIAIGDHTATTPLTEEQLAAVEGGDDPVHELVEFVEDAKKIYGYGKDVVEGVVDGLGWVGERLADFAWWAGGDVDPSTPYPPAIPLSEDSDYYYAINGGSAA